VKSLSEVAESVLGALAAYWISLWVLAGALEVALDASVEMAPVRVPLAVAWLVAGLAMLAARFLPDPLRVRALLAMALALAVGTVVARELSGLVAPWVQITVACAMLLSVMGFVGPRRLFIPTAVFVVALGSLQRAQEMLREDSPVRLGVPLTEAALVIGLGLLGLMIRAVLMRSSERADRMLVSEEERRQSAVEQRWREDAMTARMSLLHDTALNTLNAIALSPRGSSDDQRRRCVEDARRLQETTETHSGGVKPLLPALHQVVSRAETQGVTVSLLADGDPLETCDVPAGVLDALTGSIEEALLNVAKHAEVDTAVLTVTVTGSEVSATVADDGVGFDPLSTQHRHGLRHSVEGRMASVGGTTEVLSAPGRGTSVTLTWVRQNDDEPVADAVTTVVVRTLGALLLAATIFTSLVVVAEWQAFERPAVALVGGLLLGGWGLLVTYNLRQERWMPLGVGVATVALACLAPFWTIASDTYCSSTFGTLGWVDPRLPLVVVVMLTASRWWHASLAAPAFIAATLVASSVWADVFAGCPSVAVTASSVALAVFVASLIAGRALTRQADAVGRANQQRREAEWDRMRAAAARTEQQQWFQPALDSCIPLLAAIGDGSADPRSNDVRQRCREESGYLRGLVSAASAPPGVREAVLALLTRAHDAGLDVQVRGDLARLPVPSPAVVETLRSHSPRTLEHAESMVITGVGHKAHGALIVHVPGLSEQPPHRRGAPADGIEVISDEDGWWMEVSWPAVAEQPVAVSS
jgi:hypothetical protein